MVQNKPDNQRLQRRRKVTRADARKWLLKMIDAKQELDSQWDSLRKVVGVESESPFGVATWKPVELLIECVAEVIGDELGAVNWFVWDNDGGHKLLEHSLPDGTMRKVKTIDDLLDVLGF